MLKVGVTGGIGSGKSIVARTLQTLGVPVYYADTVAKRLMENDAALRNAILAHFGEAAYEGQRLNRSWLAAQVFGQPDKIALLNSLVHPAVIADGKRWMEQQKNAPYAVKEAALFFESGSAGEMDLIVGVYAPQALRIQRVMRRDGLGRQEVLSRMQQQLDERMKMKLCDVVLQNDEQEMLLPQVLRLHQMLLQKAAAGL